MYNAQFNKSSFWVRKENCCWFDQTDIWPSAERVFISAARVSETDAVADKRHDMLHTALIAQTSSCFQQWHHQSECYCFCGDSDL